MKRVISILLLLASTGLFSQEKSQVKLLFMGDVMQHGQQVRSAKMDDGSYNFHPNYSYVKHIIKSADVAIANLELTLAGAPYKGYPAFSAPDNLAMALQDAGVDFLVTANNHSLDRSKKGLERTIDVLDKLEMPHTGTFKDSLSKANSYPAYMTANGIKLAILNYTYGTNGLKVRAPNIVNYINKEEIGRDIERAKEGGADVIIVFTHWGREYQKLPDSAQKELTDFAFDKGAHLVIGAHPHVIQPIEFRDSSRYVAYSLGNFISNQRKRYTDGGMMVEVVVEKSGEGISIVDTGYYLTWVHTTPDPEHQFHILPASSYSKDTVLLNSASLKKMNLYVSDSRKLLNQHNKNSNERRNWPVIKPIEEKFGMLGDTIIVEFKSKEKVEAKEKEEDEAKVEEKAKIVKEVVEKVKAGAVDPSKGNKDLYRIQIRATSQQNAPENLPNDYQQSLRVVKNAGLFKYQVGEWASRAEAEKHLLVIRGIQEFSDAFIVVVPRAKK